MTDTSDQMSPDGTPAGDDLLAAEYVLGTLPLADRMGFETRLRADPSLERMVEQWEAHFAPLNADFAEVAAPDLMPRIEARLFPVAPRGSFSLWRGLFGGLVAAGLLAAVLLVLPLQQPVVPDLVATLSGEGQPLVFAASYDIETTSLTVTRTAGGAAGADQDYELWVIGTSGVPASLGVMLADSVTLDLKDLQPDFVLAVSLEAKGGSTNGAPTTVLVTGPVTRL